MLLHTMTDTRDAGISKNPAPVDHANRHSSSDAASDALLQKESFSLRQKSVDAAAAGKAQIGPSRVRQRHGSLAVRPGLGCL